MEIISDKCTFCGGKMFQALNITKITKEFVDFEFAEYCTNCNSYYSSNLRIGRDKIESIYNTMKFIDEYGVLIK